ncbi:hypothetical protein ACGFZU_06700 [Streptomyces tendae]|uniref:hypothetical protein n=1 Tax=Streptomyces tendae TaxID=1932 RepID=UPI00372293E6
MNAASQSRHTRAQEPAVVTCQFEAASFAQLRPGDRVKLPQIYGDALVGWWWPILTVDRVDWIRDDRTALMLRLAEPLPCGDRFVLVAGRWMVDAGVQRVLDPEHEERQRLLNRWNAARHGWRRFQASSRRAADRIARRIPNTDLEDDQS